MKKRIVLPTFLVLSLFASASGVLQAQSDGATVERIEIFGSSLEGNLLGAPDSPEVSIYLPPSYEADTNRRYPVLYLLHGYSGTDQSWFGENSRIAAPDSAERAMSSGAAAEMILVMPNCNNDYGMFFPLCIP